MVETKPKSPEGDQPTGQPREPQQERALALPQLDVGFDFASFCVAVFAVSVLFTGAVFGYRFLILERTLNEQTQQIAQLESELSNPELKKIEKQIQEIAGGIDKIRPILDEKIRYAELFWTLRKVTEKSVRWRSMGFNETKQLSLTGEAASWGNVARQLAALKQDERFSGVEMISASLQEGEKGVLVSFAVTAQVLVEKLFPPAQ